MSKAVISGYYGFGNFGDETILSVLTQHLKEKNVDVTVLSSNPEFTARNYSVNSVKSFDIKNVIKAVSNCDILISGGGSLLQDVTSLKSLVYYCFIIALGILFGKKVIIFAQGIGPINNRLACAVVINLLKQCKIVTVRDEKSLEFLKKHNVNAFQVCDPVYSLNINCTQAESAVGVQLRDFKTVNYNLLQKLALLIKNKFSDKKIKLFVLQKAYDLEILSKFGEILNSYGIISEIVTDDLINELSSLEYLFAMRFHAILCAIKCGVKTCAINYDIKVENLAKESGIPMISCDAHENTEEIYQKLQNLNPQNLIDFANGKLFDWSEFDKLFTAE